MSRLITSCLLRAGFFGRSLCIGLFIACLFSSTLLVSRNVLAVRNQTSSATSQQQLSDKPTQNAVTTTVLELGRPIERELAGGQGHTYQVTLTEGQYMSAVVEQRGVDVVVRLLGPDGKLIFTFDGAIGLQGQEQVTQVAEIAGSYQLDVQSTQATTETGRYEIRLLELRTAIETNRALQEARNLHAETTRLYVAGKYDEAILSEESVVAIYEKVMGPHHSGVGMSLYGLAILHRNKGNYVKAEPLFERALAILVKALGPEHPNIIAPLNGLASLYFEKGDYVKAEPLFQRALEICEKVLGPDHLYISAPLNNLANIYLEKGDYVRAEPLLQRSLSIREKALGPEHPDIAIPLMGLADLYRDKGDYAKAEPFYQRALAIEEKELGLVSGHIV